jgi:hypothetical protein
MLIALLHSTDVAKDEAPDFAEMELPEIHRSNTLALESDAAVRWQVRVHPRQTQEDDAAFTLVSGAPDASDDEVRIAPGQLRAALARPRDRSVAKPMLAPHRDSRSPQGADRPVVETRAET